MALYLGTVIFAFLISSVAIVPYVGWLHKIKFTRVGTPVGGGIFVVVVVSVLYRLIWSVLHRLVVPISSLFPLKTESDIIFFTFISFGLLGWYDDVVKTFYSKPGLFGLPSWHRRLAQVLLSLIVAALLYWNLHIDIMYMPFIGVWHLGWWYIPLSAAIIAFFVYAFGVSSSVDGLAGGVLAVGLLAFWVISVSSLDTPLAMFIALWLGALISFLYFNVYPARLWLGNSAMAFGASLAVVGLLLGKPVTLLVIGGILVVEGGSALVQSVGWRLFNRRLLPVAPLHRWLQLKGWGEAKIALRGWLTGVILAIFGMWFAGF